jgi:hypothetical protein
VSTKKVEQLKKRFVEEGFEAALYRKPVANVHRRKITGDEEAHLIALCCSQAPEGQDRWTLRMLAHKMVELDIVDSISHETVRQTLKKMNLNLGCLKVASRDQFSCPGFGPRSHPPPQYLGQLMGFSAYVWSSRGDQNSRHC